jgi:hypothetical protein
VILLKLVSSSSEEIAPGYARLSLALRLSGSEVFAGIRRAEVARLVTIEDRRKIRIAKNALLEFVLFGAKYAFPATWGEIVRGLPTSWAAPPLNQFITDSNEPPPVWPFGVGKVRGVAIAPLYPTAPLAAFHDPELYAALACFDAIRAGRARERELAAAYFTDRLR